MQGLPIHQLQKSAQSTGKGAAVDSSKGAHLAKGESAQVEKSQGDFASLFAGLTGKAVDGKQPEKQQDKQLGKLSGDSQVESQPGDVLKNLLAEKQSEKSAEGKVAVEPQMMAAQNSEQVMKSSVSGEGKHVEAKDLKLEQHIAKTNNSLDQLLNNLKGTQDYQPVEESEGNSELHMLRGRKTDPSKTESKNESPLDFLVKGAKGKGLTEANTTEAVKTESALAQKITSGEDFVKMHSAEKKLQPQLAVINGQKGEELAPTKLMNQNAKAYGQGMNLMNDSLIRNTKDLADKDVKKGKQNLMGVDELRTKDMKASAELASIRQEAVPGIQNNKDNHGQQNLQANSNQKVLNLSHINTANTTEIIKKISDYVEQNNVAGKQSLDLTVKHDSLGEFKIQVTKVPESMNRGLNQIDMQITTSSKEGHDFFVKNEVTLMKNLNQAGINLSDLRIVASMSESTPFGQSDSRQSSSFQQNPDGSKQYTSFESNSFSSDGGSQRRKELWEEYQQRYGA